MSTSFSATVTSARWRAEACAWIDGCLTGFGAELIGEPEQTRVRPWSTHLRVETDRGALWFKANCRALSFEASLHHTLAAIAPDIVETPWAIEPERGWLLTADHGQPSGRWQTEDAGPMLTAARWQHMVTTTADLQRRAARFTDAIRATSVPDCSPRTIPARFDALVATMSALPQNDPSHIDVDQSAALTHRRQQVVDAAAELDTSPVPVSIQHGDLHPGNTALRDGNLRIFDFGDAQWACALEVLAVPRGWAKAEPQLPWQSIRDAYLECWHDVAEHRSLIATYQAIAFTQPVNRAWTWWRLLADANEAERATWGSMPGKNLMRVLDA